MVVLGWIVLGVLGACALFVPPAMVGRGYFRELGVWLSILAIAVILTALIGFGVFAVTGHFG